MKTTLILSDELLERAREAPGLKNKTALVHAGLEALIAREALGAWRPWEARNTNFGQLRGDVPAA